MLWSLTLLESAQSFLFIWVVGLMNVVPLLENQICCSWLPLLGRNP